MSGLYLALLAAACSFGVAICELRPVERPRVCPAIDEAESERDQLRGEVRAFLSGAEYSCGGTPGWWKVGSLDMTNTSQECPTDLVYRSDDLFAAIGKTVRGCSNSGGGISCSSTFFSVGGLEYSKVCGRIRGYQYAYCRGFVQNRGLEEVYVDGVSLTHGAAGQRTHIWTFAAGAAEGSIGASNAIFQCPCDGTGNTAPAFVGEDYFCETGNNDNINPNTIFFLDDPLWDGEGCGPRSSSCCEENNVPWFTKTLPTSTTDDVELRLCQESALAEVVIDLIDLYIKY